MAQEKMTTCAHCGASIAAKAKTCPNCGGKNKKPIYKRPWFIIIIVIIVICIVMGMGGSDDPASNSSTDNGQQQEQQITYTKYDAGQMVKDLENNAMKAEKKYNDQYIKVTGKLTTIDSDGSYIDIEPTGDNFSMYSITCYLQNEEQENVVTELSTGDTVTIKGQVTEVGEVLGYSMNIDKIIK